MQIHQFQYSFESKISFDDYETVEDVTVAYDYTPAEHNYPEGPDYEEEFDVFVFNDKDRDITYDIPTKELDCLIEEAKEDFRQHVINSLQY